MSQAVLPERGRSQPHPWPCHRWGGEDGVEGMKPRHSLLLNHWWRDSCQLHVQTNSMFVLLPIHANSKLNSSPKQRGSALQQDTALPAWGLGGKRGHVPLATMYTRAHTWCTKGFWKAQPSSQLVSLHCYPAYCSRPDFATFAPTEANTAWCTFTAHSCFPVSSWNRED